MTEMGGYPMNQITSGMRQAIDDTKAQTQVRRLEAALGRIAAHACIYRSDFEEGDCLNNKHESPCPTCLARAALGVSDERAG